MPVRAIDHFLDNGSEVRAVIGAIPTCAFMPCDCSAGQRSIPGLVVTRVWSGVAAVLSADLHGDAVILIPVTARSEFSFHNRGSMGDGNVRETEGSLIFAKGAVPGDHVPLGWPVAPVTVVVIPVYVVIA